MDFYHGDFHGVSETLETLVWELAMTRWILRLEVAASRKTSLLMVAVPWDLKEFVMELVWEVSCARQGSKFDMRPYTLFASAPTHLASLHPLFLLEVALVAVQQEGFRLTLRLLPQSLAGLLERSRPTFRLPIFGSYLTTRSAALESMVS